MMTDSLKVIIRNTAVTYTVELFSKLFQFALIIFAARTLGVERFGDLSYATALYLLLYVLSDFGFSVFLTREVARDPAARDKVFHMTLRLRVVISTVFFLVLMAYLYAVRHSQDVRFFVFSTGVSLIASSYALNLVLVLRGLSMMKMDGVIRMAGALLGTSLGLAALRMGFGIKGVALSLVAGNIFMVVVAVWVNRKHGIVKTPAERTVLSDYTMMLRRSLVFVTLVILTSIFTRADTLLLQHLRGPVEVGLYHAGFKVTEALLLFQAAFAMVILPVLSGYMAVREMDTARKITELGIKYMWFSGVFVSLVVMTMADKIVDILYFSHDYSSAVAGLRILALVNLVLYVSTPVGSLLMSSAHARVAVGIQLVMVVFNIGANLIVIPAHGFAGAASVRLATEILGLTLTVMFVKKAIFPLSFFRDLPVTAAAALIVAAFILSAKSLLFVPVYFALYVTVLYLFGGVSEREFSFVKGIVTERFRSQ